MNWQVNQRCIYFYAHKLHFRDRKLKNFANICITKLKANPIFLSSHTNPFSKTMAEATKKFWVFPPLPFLQVLSLKTYYITPVLLAFWYFFCFRYAVVTGANKGIGLGICRELAANGVTVVLTARDEKRGVEAVESLKGSGISNVVFHQLDVGQPASIASLADFIKTQFGKLDILVFWKPPFLDQFSIVFSWFLWQT